MPILNYEGVYFRTEKVSFVGPMIPRLEEIDESVDRLIKFDIIVDGTEYPMVNMGVKDVWHELDHLRSLIISHIEGEKE